MIRVLGFCASPRVGNSQFLLNQALESVKARAAELGEEVEIDTAFAALRTISASCRKSG